MHRCLELAALGAGSTSPNPLVGSVVVHNGKVIGEGYHHKAGEAHAEVNAINSVADKSLLKEATVYVNLEPCSHYGKTPPCADMLVKEGVKQVVVGTLDPHDKVTGTGVKRLLSAGIDVVVGVLEEECNELNKRFFKSHKEQRPYVILKWAQTKDGFIAPADKNESKQISGAEASQLVHKWRAEEDAIMVGTNTALGDNPKLDVRNWEGKNPIRIVLDKTLRLPETLNLFDGSIPTLVFTEKAKGSRENLDYITIKFDNTLMQNLLAELHNRNILSVIVEGGTQLLDSFIKANLWDEARVFIAPFEMKEGVKAPYQPEGKTTTEMVGKDELITIKKA